MLKLYLNKVQRDTEGLKVSDFIGKRYQVG